MSLRSPIRSLRWRARLVGIAMVVSTFLVAIYARGRAHALFERLMIELDGALGRLLDRFQLGEQETTAEVGAERDVDLGDGFEQF